MTEQEKKAKIISIINMKGGVGKTTLTCNLAFNISKKNNKVLVIDADPQFNATQTLLLYNTENDLVETEPTDESDQTDVTDDSNDLGYSDKRYTAEEKSAEKYEHISKSRKTIFSIYSPENYYTDDLSKDLIYKITPELDIIPGDLKLASTISGDTSNKVAILEDYIETNKLDKEYDYIIIDCPPTWSILTHSSLYASNYYIIPSKIDFYSSIGIQLLVEQINGKITGDSQYKKTKKSLKNLGVAFMFTHNSLKGFEKQETKLKKTFDDIDFFDDRIPYIPSAATEFALYEDKRFVEKYSGLINSLDKLTDEILKKIS
ncbi:AAA family ATPase [Vagococcus fluvialis]|uniref:ParA family protein n=1 Tax=Vagococcus fluvialis TaxID=2738 RepID=UPI001A902E40|nr:AAA family ATPase [Vagococcus fluvialis]MBO0479631.1 AAA family ATPase [Vagococcus fluvialis]MBO0485385.1 AAA family ATPase [Vagococcus fluvialis]